MRYKLALNHTPSGSFHVTATAVDSSSLPVTTQYKDDEAFLRLIDRANLASDEYARLVYATMITVTSPGMSPCCEEVTLDSLQLDLLQLNGCEIKVA
jgi:hypothetical protein